MFKFLGGNENPVLAESIEEKTKWFMTTFLGAVQATFFKCCESLWLWWKATTELVLC